MSWKDRWEGRSCGRCNARRDLFRVVECHPPFRGRANDGWIYMTRARCVDRDACDGRIEKREGRARERSGVFVLAEPRAPDAKPGWCRWCGVELSEPEKARRYGRRYCYPDREGRDCIGEWRTSRTWEPREAVRHRARATYGVVACVDCGVVCEGTDEMDGTDAVAWEADHEIPLEDGGEHTIENLRCRCVPCHRAKTAREATARAEARRVHTFPQSKIGPFMDAMRDPEGGYPAAGPRSRNAPEPTATSVAPASVNAE